MNEIDTARLLTETDLYLAWQRSAQQAMRLSAAMARADAAMTAAARGMIPVIVLAAAVCLDDWLRIAPPVLFLGAWLVALCRWLWRYVQAIRAEVAVERLRRGMW